MNSAPSAGLSRTVTATMRSLGPSDSEPPALGEVSDDRGSSTGDSPAHSQQGSIASPVGATRVESSCDARRDETGRMGEDFIDGVRQWLEKSGHAFELRTARAFREGGAKPVTLSFAYTDPNSGALREGDVLAQFGWTAMNNTPASVEVVVECKSGRDHPWVAFYDKVFARGSELEDWVYRAHGPFVGVTEPLADAWIGAPPFDATRIESHLVAAHTKDSHNPASDAVRQVLSAAEGRWQRYLERQRQDRRGCVIVPVVVTAGRLVECQLDTDGTVRLEEVPSAVVAGPRRGDKSARVFVVTESAVAQFARSIVEMTARANEQAQFRQ